MTITYRLQAGGASSEYSAADFYRDLGPAFRQDSQVDKKRREKLSNATAEEALHRIQ